MLAFHTRGIDLPQLGNPNATAVFAEDYREEPYWWQAAHPGEFTASTGSLEGARADVVIVGSGVTGLVAALTLARHGADVLVIDSGKIGGGAARMNAGFLGRTLKRSVDWLEAHCGTEHAIGIYRELDEALQGIQELAQKEAIDSHLRICGRFVAANSESHLRNLISDLEAVRRKLGFNYEVVSKSDLRTELSSDRYHGGAVMPDLGSIHPGLYHAGLVARAQATGVRFQERTEVFDISDAGNGKTVQTAAGAISAKHVALATNGYTTRKLKWFARRLVPFRGYVVATEILSPELIDRVLPKRRTYLDTKMNIDFIRPAPDSERILFGGMTGGLATSATTLVPALYKRMTEILPDLEGVRVSRSWTGFCAGTFDFMPHIGRRNGVHFALGYNFAGVPIGTHFGRKLAARIIGTDEGVSHFDVEKFPTLPFYNGTGLVAPIAMRYFDWYDRMIAKGKGQ